jgi:hypothetical protein
MTSINDLGNPDSELADPILGISPPSRSETVPSTTEDPWMKVTASFSASNFQSQYGEFYWGFSVGGGVSFGPFSAGGSYSHDETSR